MLQKQQTLRLGADKADAGTSTRADAGTRCGEPFPDSVNRRPTLEASTATPRGKPHGRSTMWQVALWEWRGCERRQQRLFLVDSCRYQQVCAGHAGQGAGEVLGATATICRGIMYPITVLKPMMPDRVLTVWNMEETHTNHASHSCSVQKKVYAPGQSVDLVLQQWWRVGCVEGRGRMERCRSAEPWARGNAPNTARSARGWRGVWRSLSPTPATPRPLLLPAPPPSPADSWRCEAGARHPVSV